jgi:Holin of 3TMs, for gene-transfer release
MGGLDVAGIGSIADLLKTAVDKIWPDPTQAAAAKIAILQAQQAGALKEADDQFQIALEQIKTNAAEAAQPGLNFRDGAGWVCVASFALAALKAPIEWVCSLVGHPISLPSIDQSTTVPMLLALLGIGSLHTYQAIKS